MQKQQKGMATLAVIFVVAALLMGYFALKQLQIDSVINTIPKPTLEERVKIDAAREKEAFLPLPGLYEYRTTAKDGTEMVVQMLLSSGMDKVAVEMRVQGYDKVISGEADIQLDGQVIDYDNIQGAKLFFQPYGTIFKVRANGDLMIGEESDAPILFHLKLTTAEHSQGPGHDK